MFHPYLSLRHWMTSYANIIFEQFNFQEKFTKISERFVCLCNIHKQNIKKCMSLHVNTVRWTLLRSKLKCQKYTAEQLSKIKIALIYVYRFWWLIKRRIIIFYWKFIIIKYFLNSYMIWILILLLGMACENYCSNTYLLCMIFYNNL